MMISTLTSYSYFLAPLWVLVIVFLKLKKPVIVTLPLAFFFLIALALFINKEKVAQSLAITGYFLLLISLIYLKLDEKN